MKRRTIGRVFILMLCLTLVLCSCGDKPTTQKADGRITIKWMGYPFSELNDNGYSEKLIEDRFDVNIEPVTLSSSAYQTKKPLMLAGGEEFDIIYELDPKDVQSDAKQGFLLELPYELLKEKIPGVVATINEEEPKAWMYSYYEGKNYGIPNMYYQGEYPQIGQWRLDWLQKLGIDKVPETLDEMHDALYKMANNDPDGNGKKDTYGMSGDVKNWYFTFPEIFGAYGTLPFSWMEENGKIVYGGVTEGTKEALKTLAEWYKEGIIHPDFITDDINGSAYSERFINGEIGYNSVGGYNYDAFDANVVDGRTYTMKKIDPDAQLAVALPPKGPEGKSGGFAWGIGGHVISIAKSVGEDEAKLNKIFEILEAMNNDQDFAAKLVMGEEGTHYTIDEDGVVTYKAPYDVSKERAKEFGASSVDQPSFFNIIPIKPETRDNFRPKAQVKHVEEYVSKATPLNDVFLKPDVVEGSSTYLGNIQAKQMQYIAKIIRGDEPIEYYDEFIREWNEGDGATLTKNANATMKIMDKILKQVK